MMVNKIVENKVYNIDLVVEDIKEFPQTYKTILQDEYLNGSFQIIIRRKLASLYKKGEIFKTNIPGTRFGTVIFYSNPKKYYILVLANRRGSDVFTFFDYKKVGKFYIDVPKYWKLEHNKWIEYNEKLLVFEGHVLKMI